MRKKIEPIAFPWRTLARPLTAKQRRVLAGHLAALVRWHETLTRWPSAPSASRGVPDATPFVSLYVRGGVRGCYGSAEGRPAERIARAFLRAATDVRFGGLAPGQRGESVASVSYATAPRAPLRGDAVLAALEVGTHGVVLVRPGGHVAVLLPQVARDGGLDAEAFLATLARKAGLDTDGWRDGDVLLFEAETVSSNESTPRRADARGLAASWLADQVDGRGVVRFGVDARTGERYASGPMFHGRACTLVQALTDTRHAATAARARRWLTRELRAGLAGERPDGWPDDPAMIAGTLALAVLAGAATRQELAQLVASDETARALAGSAWHAAQVAVALGATTPRAIWQAAVADLATRPFAPWTLMAARARRDAAVTARCERGLCAALRSDAPHRGGARGTVVPEIALTAVAVEALAPLASKSRAARDAVARGRDFLRRWQLVPGAIPAALDPALATGAFPASPVHYALRCDITAHALLALA